MVISCCVCGIEKGSLQDFNLTFHKFPKNEDLKLKWWDAIGKKVTYRNASVCSQHFKVEDYKNHEDPNLVRKILKSSVIPSEFSKLNGRLISFKNSSNPIDLSVKKCNSESLESLDRTKLKHEHNIQNESCEDRLQDNILSASISINNSPNKSKNDTILHSIASHAKKSTQTKKQRCQDALLGTMRREDFTNESAWLRFQKYVNETRKQRRLLLLKNSRLHLKISSVLESLKTKKKQLLSDLPKRKK